VGSAAIESSANTLPTPKPKPGNEAKPTLPSGCKRTTLPLCCTPPLPAIVTSP